MKPSDSPIGAEMPTTSNSLRAMRLRSSLVRTASGAYLTDTEGFFMAGDLDFFNR